MSQNPPEMDHEGLETMIGAPPAQLAVGHTCPNCGQPLEGEGRFCQACGAQIVADPVAVAEAEQEEKPRPWLLLVVVLWLIIMVAALYFIFGRAMVVGSG